MCHNIGLSCPARVVKLVDSGDSKSPAARRAGSSPAPGTIYSGDPAFQRGFFFPRPLFPRPVAQWRMGLDVQTFLHRFKRTLRLTFAKNEAFASTIAQANMARLAWTALVVVPLNLIHIAIFWRITPDPAQLQTARWANALGWTHLCMALVMLVLGLMARRLHQPDASAKATQWMSIVTVLVGLLFAAWVVAIDQMITTNITPFLIGTLLMGVLFGLRPRDALIIYSFAFVFFALGLGWMQTEATVLLTNRLNGLTAVAVGLILSVSNWRKNTENLLLRRKLDRRQAILQTKYSQLEVLATRDSLTGLYNRKEFMRLSELELTRAARYGLPVCIVIADVDHFKHVNDEYGHPVGDLVLRHMASLLRAATRTTDLVGRLGGEEFILLLPQTSLDEGLQLAEKMRILIEMSPTQIPQNRRGQAKVPITVSLGVVGVAAGESADLISLYSQADKALYRAKGEGRNRVEAAQPKDNVSQLEE